MIYRHDHSNEEKTSGGWSFNWQHVDEYYNKDLQAYTYYIKDRFHEEFLLAVRPDMRLDSKDFLLFKLAGGFKFYEEALEPQTLEDKVEKDKVEDKKKEERFIV